MLYENNFFLNVVKSSNTKRKILIFKIIIKFDDFNIQTNFEMKNVRIVRHNKSWLSIYESTASTKHYGALTAA